MLTDDQYAELFAAEDSARAFVRLVDLLNASLDRYDEENWSTAANQYVSIVLGFLDSSDLDADLISAVGRRIDGDFHTWFIEFRNSVSYVQARLRFMRLRAGGVGYVPIAVSINPNLREEIQDNLEKVRKAVAVMQLEERKREAIFKKLRALQLEVDKTRTRIDAAMDLMLELTETVGKSAENLEPLAGLMERFRKLFAGAQRESEAIPDGRSGQKQLPNPATKVQKSSNDGSRSGGGDLDDDIPF
jgi:hypothetical protein